MSCTKPILALNLGKDSSTGKNIIKILPKRVDSNIRALEERYGKDSLVMLPCGRCAGCIASRRKEWSSRCYLESLSHKQNCFITLTYDDAHVPVKLVKKDLSTFIKKLRSKLDCAIRFFGCGEYGGQTGRPHYHLIIFGWFPSDFKYSHKSESGFPIFTSKLVSDVWSKGLCVVQEFTPETAGYVAGYTEKKLCKDDGFILMSNRPGLGKEYFLKHFDDIYMYDHLLINGYKFKVPRYFDKLFDSIDSSRLDKIKRKRIESSRLEVINCCNVHQYENQEEMLQAKDSIYVDKLERRKRKL